MCLSSRCNYGSKKRNWERKKENFRINVREVGGQVLSTVRNQSISELLLMQTDQGANSPCVIRLIMQTSIEHDSNPFQNGAHCNFPERLPKLPPP